MRIISQIIILFALALGITADRDIASFKAVAKTLANTPARSPAEFIQIPPRVGGREYGYLAPNEHFPQQARKIVEAASAGVYVSVGTDRGFNNSSLSSKVSHLLLMDIDPTAIEFNRINTGLLQMCKDREDYLRLRLKATFEEWVELARSSHTLTEPSKSLIINHDAFDRWQHKVRFSESFDVLHSPPEKNGAFFGANYLHDDTQFSRIENLAKTDRIQSVLVDMNETARVQLLVEKLRSAGITLSTLDLSNAWIDYYLKSDKLSEVLKAFESISQPDSTFLITTYSKVFGESDWTYLGFQFSAIREHGTVAQFVKTLNGSMAVTGAQFSGTIFKTNECITGVIREQIKSSPPPKPFRLGIRRSS